MSKHAYVYLLESTGRTYIGATYDPDHRLRQHNGQIGGGAKATQGRIWDRVLALCGLPDWRTALQVEWAWKHVCRKYKYKGLNGRIEGLFRLLEQPRATSKAKPYVEWTDGICLCVGAAWRGVRTKIEGWLGRWAERGSPFRVSILPSSDPTTFLSFKMSAVSKSASTLSVTSADLAALVKAITALTEQTAANNKLVAALLSKGTALSSESVPVAAPTKGGRGKKAKAEKAPKVKPTPPSAEEGTIRFGPASEGDYKEFSVFFKAPFTLGGKTYASLANYFHSAKFTGTDDDFAEDIRTQKNPALTRAKASSVKDHTPREDWDTAKLTVMRDGLLAKFRSSSALKRKLLSTGESPLESTQEEEMRVKGFWSIGEDGTGANHMGKLLMTVRDTLRADGPVEDDEEEAPAAPAPSKKGPKAKATPAPKSAPAKPAPAAKPAADSDSDSDSEEEEAPKPATKPAPAAKPAPKATTVPKKPTPPAEEDDESGSDSDDE